MFAGLYAAATKADEMANYLMATGMLLHLAASFEAWWISSKRC